MIFIAIVPERPRAVAAVPSSRGCLCDLPGKPSDGTSDGYTSRPCTAMSPSSMSLSLIRSGMTNPTSLRMMNVAIAVKQITQSAASRLHLEQVQRCRYRRTTACRPC